MSLYNKTTGTASVKGMVVNQNIFSKEALQYHAPTTFLTFLYILVSHSRITYHKDCKLAIT